MLDFIKECGAAETEIILKTDQEPAIEALVWSRREEQPSLSWKSPQSASVAATECGERLGTRIQFEKQLAIFMVFMAEYAAYESAENEQRSWPLSLVRSSCGRYDTECSLA